ncbi:MAG: hypothetical protein UY67_C0020G0002 [Candidatus Kaiserbacteria bacterium GW2011_GWA2_52_12]|uniref:Peptidase C39 domain-containing protein n=1 Tax=Candidatus Kaiserbacteria bacterium GW2011_GWA2_52_12 TaxID=1618671 RepID=A0A0G1WXM0_9BACT|nr:MAG: hypothetical protein UY67_C0020G0002 [Candidatus Kaiserbacteria bacterium GW2011_GWA2_52_12]
MAEQAPLHVPFSYQSESFNCGPHTLRLVMQFLGNDVDESKLREYGKTTIEEGTSCENMTRAARLAHFWAYGSFDGKIEDLEHFFKLGYPAIVQSRGVRKPHRFTTRTSPCTTRSRPTQLIRAVRTCASRLTNFSNFGVVARGAAKRIGSSSSQKISSTSVL